jgi:GxxExxY protein
MADRLSEGPNDIRESGEDLDALARNVIAAAIEVHRELGPGYLESVYEQALAVELSLRGVSFERQKVFGLKYKGHDIGEGRLDFLVEGRLVLELKTVETLLSIHKAQVISYLKPTGHHLGLLVNFNVAVLKQGIQRIVLS